MVLTAASLIQTGLLDQLLILDRVRVDLLLIVLLGIGFSADTPTAVLLGFTTGLVVDLFRFGPFGLHALLFCLAAWMLVLAKERMLQSGGLFRTVQGAIASILVTAATWVGAAVFGQNSPPFTNTTLIDLLWVGLIGAVLIHQAERVGRWMIHDALTRLPQTDMVRTQ